MATVTYVEEASATDRVKEIYVDIKKTFGTPFVPNLFKAMANHPAYLETTWARFKTIMGPGKLDPKTKQVIALAVSATNNCEYCINAHNGRAQGDGVWRSRDHGANGCGRPVQWAQQVLGWAPG